MYPRALLLAALAVSVASASSAERLPSFSVEAGDGHIRFDNVEVREHPHSGAALFDAIAVNRTGCDFRKLEIELVLVAGEGDRIARLPMGDFRSGETVRLTGRVVPGPAQEIQHVHGVYATGPMICAKAVAAAKAAEARRAREEAERAEAAKAAARRAEEERAERVASARAKASVAGYRGLALGLDARELEALQGTPDFPWRRYGAGDAENAGEREMRCQPEDGCPFESAKLGFESGKVARLRIRTAALPSSAAVEGVRERAGSALAELVDAYGKPTRVFLPPSRIQASAIRKGRAIPLAEWKRDGHVVRLAAEPGPDGYGVEVRLEAREDGGRKGSDAGKRRAGRK